jgi:DNA-3-methyladenine glycosylase II
MVFEALANAIACQQMSLSVGILLLSRITENFGVAVEGTAGIAHAFPQPEDLADLELTAFRQLGFNCQRALAYRPGAHLRRRTSRFGSAAGLNDKATTERLLELRWVGRWSAKYVLLRGLGRLNVYPGDDVGARNNLKCWPKPLLRQRLKLSIT